MDRIVPGYLPLHMTRDDVEGRLIIKQVIEPKPSADVHRLAHGAQGEGVGVVGGEVGGGTTTA